MDEVQTNVISREISVKTNLMVKDNGKSLSVPNYGSKSRGNSKSKDFDKSRMKWFICPKIEHLRNYFPEKGDNEDYIHIIAYLEKDGYESASVVVVSSLEVEKELDHGISMLLSQGPNERIPWDFEAGRRWSHSTQWQ